MSKQSKQVKDIRVIEFIDEGDVTKSQWRLQLNRGDGWYDVKVKSTLDWRIFNELQQGIK